MAGTDLTGVVIAVELFVFAGLGFGSEGVGFASAGAGTTAAGRGAAAIEAATGGGGGTLLTCVFCDDNSRSSACLAFAF